MATTSQLRTRGAVSRNFRGAYDILVRPAGSFTAIERERDLVQRNYLGGITRRQYQEIKGLPGVEVAARSPTSATRRCPPPSRSPWTA